MYVRIFSRYFYLVKTKMTELTRTIGKQSVYLPVAIYILGFVYILSRIELVNISLVIARTTRHARPQITATTIRYAIPRKNRHQSIVML